MPSYSSGLAKGLQEPEPPYREDYAFGADLGDFNASGWNAIPTLWDATSNYDLTPISVNHEVVVCRVGISNTNKGETDFRMIWYNNDTGVKLYTFRWLYYSGAGGWIYCYSYIGWCAWEINANGNYSCVIEVTGAHSYSKTLTFTVEGIPSGYHTPGYLWAEGNYLHYTDGAGVERRILGTAV